MDDLNLQSKHIIPVILATDANYIPPTCVTIISVLENSSIVDEYKFYILVPERFNETILEKMEFITKKYNNATIEYIEMQEAFRNIETTIPHITTPTYYRLNAPSLFPQYDKIIYLDSDVVVEGNLAEYYSIDIEGFYIAGVKAPGTCMRKKGMKEYCEANDLPANDQYINAGVLLMNLKELRENKVEEEFLKRTKKNYQAQDQGIINSVCYGHIKHLEYKYNCTVNSYERRFQFDDLKKVFSETEINEAHSNPFIVHYADKNKPWKNFSCSLADRWWKYAHLSPFFKEFLLDNYQLFIDNGQKGRLEFLGYRAIYNRINERMKNYLAALIDIQLLNDAANFELQWVSDILAKITSFEFIETNGKGCVIESYKGDLNIDLKIKTNGNLKISLKSRDVSDKAGKKVPFWINYKMLRYNNVIEFAGSKYAWHDKPIIISHEVKAGETVHLRVEWLPSKLEDPYFTKQLVEQLKDADKKLRNSLFREVSLKKSISFRIGRIITWLPRKIRDIFNLICETIIYVYSR